MIRVEENLKMIKEVGKFRLTNDGAAITSVLVDISQSLAVIADKMEMDYERDNNKM